MPIKKYILYIIAVFLVGSTSCTDETTLFPQASADGMVNVSFSVNVQRFNEVTTRATVADENAIINLSLLVFNENGEFISRHNAGVSGTTANGDLMFSSSLPSSSTKKIIHFIANYNWASFNHDDALGKNEGEIIAGITTDRFCMWQRVELADGISEASFSPGNPVALLRNMAKFKVVLGEHVTSSSLFQRGSFKVARKPNLGTVAPFNSQTDVFAVGSITEPASVLYNQSTPYFVNVNLDEYDYSFEKRNSMVPESERTAILLLGLYNGEATYYKIDLIDNVTGKPFDIERNYYYKITITDILKKGYSTEEEALTNAAANNSLVNVSLQKYPIITNVKSKLEVEKTTIYFPHTGGNLNTWYNFYPDFYTHPTVKDNVLVDVSVLNDEAGILSGFSYSNGTISALVPDKSSSAGPNDIYMAEIRVSVNTTEGPLYRDIIVEMRKLYDFSNVTLDDKVHNAVFYNQGDNVPLKFTVPNVASDMFPMEIKIYPSPVLYPVNSDLKAQYDAAGNLYYSYTATSSGQKVVNFKMAEKVDPNSVYTSRTVTISANGFNDASIVFNNQYIFEGTVKYEFNYSQDAANPDLRTEPVPVDGDVYSSAGMVGMVSDGVYWGFPPSGFDPTDEATHDLPFTFTYRRVFNDNVTRFFSVTKRAGQLLDQAEQNLVLKHTGTIMSATIVSPDALTVLKGSKITAGFEGTTITSSSIEMVGDNKFRMLYNFPDGIILQNQFVKINFATRYTSANSVETRIYKAHTSLAGIRDNGYRLSNTSANPTVIELYERVFAGSIYLKNSNNTYSAPATASIASSVENSSVTINYDGAYTINLPGTLPETASITITVVENGVTYKGTFSVIQLRSNSSIILVAP